jgi:rhomboid protease GluP
MLCPDCRKLISVSAPVCPYCGARRPGMWGFGPALQRFLGGRLDPVTMIPALCIGLYVLALAIDLRSLTGLGGSVFGLLAPTGRALAILGSTQSSDLTGRPWTVLTAIYLHGGLLHILFNVMWTRSLGPEVQRAFGASRFFLIWTIAGAVGFLASDAAPLLLGWRDASSVGASGSIFGLMGALIVYGRSVGASLMTRQLWTWAIVLGAMGFLFPGVDNLAHAGGFVGGFAMATLFRTGIGRPAGRLLAGLALFLGAATLLGFVLNVGRALAYFLSA